MAVLNFQTSLEEEKIAISRIRSFWLIVQIFCILYNEYDLFGRTINWVLPSVRHEICLFLDLIFV